MLFINHATIAKYGNQLEMTASEFDKTIDVNVKASFMLIKECVSMMPDGSNILLCSSYGSFDPYYTIGVYGATKAFLNSLVKSLS